MTSSVLLANGNMYEINSSHCQWKKVYKNMEFLAWVIDKEEARRVIWIEINKELDEPFKYLTDNMFTPVIPVRKIKE